MISISINQINYVLALEKTGSFSKAADICFVTQSTLSTMVRKLEDQIELEIFDRKTKPIRLTQEGKLLIKQFKRIHHEYENLNEIVQSTKDDFFGTLSLGIIPTLAPFLLPLFLDKMVKKYPNVNFSINEITTNEITKKIKSRELDIGILSLPIENKGLVQKNLFYEDFLVYDTRGDSKIKKKYAIKDIDANRLWLLEEGHCLTDQIVKICHLREKRNVSNNLLFRSGSILSLLELVKMNDGVTLLPRLATQRKNLIDSKFIYTMASPTPVREIGLVYHPNLAKKRLLSILVKEVCSAAKPFLKKTKKVRVVKP